MSPVLASPLQSNTTQPALTLPIPSRGENNTNSKISDISQKTFLLFIEISQTAGRAIVVGVVFIAETTWKLSKELGKIVIISGVIFVWIKLYLPAAMCSRAITTVLLAPVVEEILFRGVLLTTFEYMQKGSNQIHRWRYNTEPTAADLEAQKIFRVRLSAVIFGAVHLTNGHSLAGSLFQVTHCIFGGLSYGYLKERTNSLALPIIGHSVNNAFSPLLTIAAKSSAPILALPILGLWAGQQVFWYKYATRPEEIPG